MGTGRARRRQINHAVAALPGDEGPLGALGRVGRGMALLAEHAGWVAGPELGGEELLEDHEGFLRRKLSRLGYLRGDDDPDLEGAVRQLRAECDLPPGGAVGPRVWAALVQLSGVEPLRSPRLWRSRRWPALERALRVRAAELGAARRPGGLSFSTGEPAAWPEAEATLRALLQAPELPLDELAVLALDPERAAGHLRRRALRAQRGAGQGLSFSMDGEPPLDPAGADPLALALLAEDQAADGWEPAPAEPRTPRGGWGLSLSFGLEERAADVDSAAKHDGAPEEAPPELPHAHIDAALAALLDQEEGAAEPLGRALERLLSSGDDFLWGSLDRTRRWLGRHLGRVGDREGLLGLLRAATRGTDAEVQGATLRHLGRWLVRRGAAVAAALEGAGAAVVAWLRGTWAGQSVHLQQSIDGDTRAVLPAGTPPEVLRADLEALAARTRRVVLGLEALGVAAGVFTQVAGALAGRPMRWIGLAAQLLVGLGSLADLGEALAEGS